MPSGGQPDFSEKAISRAVLRQTSQHPAVLYPAGVGVVGGLAVLALGPSLLGLGALAAGGALALGGWAVNQWLRRDHFASRYVKALRERLADEHTEVLQALESGLTEIASKPGLLQLRRVQEKFEAFGNVLRSKLKPGELTYSRYLGIAEQVYFAVLDNLDRIVNVSRGIAAIDLNYTGERLAELEALQRPAEAESRELESLRQRVALAKQQRGQIKDWLAANELAMTQLDHTAMTLAGTDTMRGLARLDLETAMTELQRLAAATALYERDRLND